MAPPSPSGEPSHKLLSDGSATMVQVELSQAVLCRLLREQSLVACELRCLDLASREVVRDTIKACAMRGSLSHSA